MQDDRKYCVYRHTSPSGKVYIGITCQNPIRRWAHGHGYRNNSYFQSAIQKYGWDNFSHEILFAGLSKVEACKKEVELICAHKSNNENFGYNLSSGGEFPTTGIKHSKETKRKLSEGRRGEKHPLYGKTISEEQRRKMSEAHKGKTLSPEQRKQISERQMGEKNHNFGKTASDEVRKKMSESHRKYIVVQMDTDGKAICTYPTTRAAAKAVGGYSQSISAVCRGEQNTTAGYRWRYEPI